MSWQKETMEAFGKQTLLKREGRGELSPRREKHIHELVAIVIVVIPIAFGMPAVPVYVPPAVPLIPAMLPTSSKFRPDWGGLTSCPIKHPWGENVANDSPHHKPLKIKTL